jgi:hypothetical protein
MGLEGYEHSESPAAFDAGGQQWRSASRHYVEAFAEGALLELGRELRRGHAGAFLVPVVGRH